jgi:hypothetical protein
MASIDTVGDAQEMVVALLRESGRVFEEHSIRRQVCETIATTGHFVTPVDPRTIRPEMRLIEDLGRG